MTPQELCEQLGGFCSANKMTAVVNGKPQYIAKLGKDGTYEFTKLGKSLAAEANAKANLGLASPDEHRELTPEEYEERFERSIDDPVTEEEVDARNEADDLAEGLVDPEDEED